MAWVRMLVPISGGRADGSLWPNPYNSDGLLECGDAEAEDLIRAQVAVRAQAPVKPPAEEPVRSVTVAAPAAEAAAEEEPEPETAAGHPEPSPSDPKPAWVEWAVHNGADRDEAMRMSKADLQSRYGGRL